MLRLEDKPRTQQGHQEDIVKTTKSQKGQVRTNLGQAEDRKRTYKGLHRQKVQFTDIFIISHWKSSYHIQQFLQEISSSKPNPSQNHSFVYLTNYLAVSLKHEAIQYFCLFKFCDFTILMNLIQKTGLKSNSLTCFC